MRGVIDIDVLGGMAISHALPGCKSYGGVRGGECRGGLRGRAAL